MTGKTIKNTIQNRKIHASVFLVVLYVGWTGENI